MDGLNHYQWMHQEEIKDMEFELEQRERLQKLIQSVDPDSSVFALLKQALRVVENMIRNKKKEYKKKYGSTLRILK